jgi:DNA polymerase I
MLTIDKMIDSVSQVSASAHDVARINSIADLYKDQRQDSKMPTFLLTYGGTFMGMMAQGNFTMDMAKQIEARYHELYKVSDDVIAARLDEAARVGYITVAFGLRVRTPLLHQVVRNTRATPYEAQAEGRTAGNAMGQSYCLLNSRALTEFMGHVRAHQDYRTQIKPISQIHDASYLLTRDDVGLLSWVNKHLVEAVEWQDDPAIMHDIVKLGGELSLFHPSWAHEAVIANGASEQDILQAACDHLNKLAEKGILPKA